MCVCVLSSLIINPVKVHAYNSLQQLSIGVRETEWIQLTQLGLGKALDATNPHPWASKSSYQAKEVRHGVRVVFSFQRV